MQEARFDFGRERFRLRDAQDACDQERPAFEEFYDPESRLAVADEMVPAVGGRDEAHDVCGDADLMHVGRRRLRDIRVTLHQDPHLPLLAHGLLRPRDRGRPSDGEGRNMPRK